MGSVGPAYAGLAVYGRTIMEPTKIKMPKLLIIQPALMHYRQAVYNAVAKRFFVSVVCGGSSVDPEFSNFETTIVPVSRRAGFSWQHGVIPLARKLGPDAVWIAADVNCVSSLILTLWCRLRRIPVILHGQGLVKRSRLAPLREIMLKLWIRLATVYVGYADVCTESLLRAGVPADKLKTISNRLEAPRISDTLHQTSEQGVLFVGRLRSGCEIEMLIGVVQKINADRQIPFLLHIVGAGEDQSVVQEAASRFPWLIWHGEVTSEHELRRIATTCVIGVYPGNSGLSVLTYMQLGLAPIVGDDISRHMGPEPSWVTNNENGWTFSHGDSSSLIETLNEAADSPLLREIRSAALNTFNSLHSTSYGLEMAELILRVRTKI